MRLGHKELFRYAVSTAFSVSLIITACKIGYSQTGSTEPRKLDEFGNVSTDDAMAHLDLFAVKLNSNPNLQGLIVGHNRSDSPTGWFLRQAYGYLDYLVNSRGILGSRVRVLEGDVRKEIGFELWVLPVGSASPIPVSTPEFNPDGPVQFDRASLGNESECVGEFTIELYKLEDALKFFGEALRRQSSAKAWIVIHPSQRDSATKAVGTINRSTNLLTGKYGIDPNRILTAIRGRRSPTCMEVNLWIAPSNLTKANESAYYFHLMDEAEKTNYTVRKVEFSGNQHIRDKTLRRAFLQQEGDVFSRRALDRSLRNFSRLGLVYPLTLNDVEVRLDREEKLIDFTIYFRELPRVRRGSKIH